MGMVLAHVAGAKELAWRQRRTWATAEEEDRRRTKNDVW